MKKGAILVNIKDAGNTIYKFPMVSEYEFSEDKKFLYPIIKEAEYTNEKDLNLTKILLDLIDLYEKKDKKEYMDSLKDFLENNFLAYAPLTFNNLIYSKDKMEMSDSELSEHIKKSCKVNINDFNKELSEIVNKVKFILYLKACVIDKKPEYFRDFLLDNNVSFTGKNKFIEGIGDINDENLCDRVTKVFKAIAYETFRCDFYRKLEYKISIEPFKENAYASPFINNIFDLCYYKLNKLFCNLYNEFNKNEVVQIMNDELSICPYCGKFYIKESSRQVTCGSKECTKEKNNETRRNFYKNHNK